MKEQNQINAERDSTRRTESRLGKTRAQKALTWLLVVLLITPVLLAGWTPKPTVEPKRERKAVTKKENICGAP
jgi:hypothetical protein